MNVKAWSEKVNIPTYKAGEPEKLPAFLERRVYQGSSGKVYPKPIIEKIYDEKQDKEWQALFLENKYIRIMLLPELGGRVQMAYDKLKDRHFVYHNNVIKPALVGLAGPWISGGIEFNWPQHHRPSTFEPTEYYIEENEDGSKTVWCNEVEEMTRTKGMAGFTLYPDKAYLEIKVKLFNRTKQPQTFLWWANPAVAVNDAWQAVFPPDVNAVFDHGKRDVSEFPIAKGTYYKVDYSEGVDISRYKNMPVPTSYMVAESKYDFVGGYEHDTKGGLLHIADHHISPGKKLWTWGNGDFGQAWYRNLTDNDGPYVELMCGVYTDNQPDFSWLAPYEEKSFKQYFMPYSDIGLVKNANKDIILNLEFEEKQAIIKLYATSAQDDLQVLLQAEQQEFLNDRISISPENTYIKKVNIDSDIREQNYTIIINDSNGKEVLRYQPEKKNLDDFPDPAKAAPKPQEIKTTEKLYLTGLHLEQYRHATFKAEDYYQEALERDPGDVRNNNSLGLLLLRRGRINKAEPYFRKAIDRLTTYNPNPYQGEPYYNLGQCLKYQNELDSAYDNFYKACWNSEWKAASYFALAQISINRKNFKKAFEQIEKALKENAANHKVQHLKIVILRKLDRFSEAKNLLQSYLYTDIFNFNLHYERILLARQDERQKFASKLISLIGNKVQNYIEYSLDYASAGLYQEACGILDLYLEQSESIYPMVYYLKGWYSYLEGNFQNASSLFKKGSQSSPDYCFPNKIEEMLALKAATEINPQDSKAYYYLGNFWYSKKQYTRAKECWERSKNIYENFYIVRRNLALAYFNKENKSEPALQELEAAYELNSDNSRLMMELDQLYKKLNYSYQDRLKFLESNPDNVEFRDDLYLSRVTLYNVLQKHKKALELLMARKFHPWEGGEGKVTRQYVFSHIELAKIEIENKNYKKALKHLKATENYPENLGEGKLPIATENDIHFWKGWVYDAQNKKKESKREWELATQGSFELSLAMYYNDQASDNIFYQGMAYKKLSEEKKAKKYFNRLIDYGQDHIDDDIEIDYFAVSLPDLMIWDEDLNKLNRIHCLYLIALGYLGLEKYELARDYFEKVLNKDRYHQGAFIHKNMLKILS